MGKGFKHGASGATKEAENHLNFEIVASPAENTIGLITTNPIRGWYFTATQPENAAEGEVWVNVGASSEVAFNALKENTINVYPLSVKQYVSSAWVDVTAKSYQNEKWVDWWNGELFRYGNEYTGATGGWKATPLKWKSGDDSKPGEMKIEPSPSGGNKLTIAVNHGVLWHTVNKIDLTDVKTIKFVGSLSHGSYTALGIYPAIEYLSTGTVAELTGIKDYGEYTLDVSSLSGSFYIGFRVYSTVSTVVVDELVTVRGDTNENNLS